VETRGTNFDNPVVTSVDIGGTPVSAFRVLDRERAASYHRWKIFES
jgi:hypothetical protein